MQSPVAPRVTMVSREFEPGLTVFVCPISGGVWLDGAAYWAWLRRRPGFPTPVPSIEGPPVGAESDTPGARVSPRSGRLMRKFRVGGGIAFHVEHDAATGSFWLDGGEYEALVDRRLHDELHLICTEHHHRALIAREAEAARRIVASRRLGECTVEEIEAFVCRLGSLDGGPEAIAYLLERLDALRLR